MLNGLVIFGVFLISASGKPHRAGKDKDSVSQHEQPSPVVTYAYDANCCTTQTAPKSNQQMNHWYTSLQDPNWWLVIVAAGTGGVVSWQAWETRKAAEATLRAAKATEATVTFVGQQTELQIHERRGIIRLSCEPIEVDHTGTERFLVGTLKLTNIGDSALQIRDGNGGLFIEKFENGLVEVLGEQTESNNTSRWIRSESETSFEIFSSPEINEELWAKLDIIPIALFMRGEISYNSMGYNWIRRFAFRWNSNIDTMELLDGYWEEDPHHSNEEDKLSPDAIVPF